MTPHLTSVENIVITILFHWLGEDRNNRTFDEYMAIGCRVPKIEAVHAYVNEQLKRLAESGKQPYGICDFRTEDRRIWYRDFPRSVSREPVRTALHKFFLRDRCFLTSD